MGRVYNALVKAQQWDDRPSPMGPPAGRETDTEEISSFDFEDSLALAEEVAQPRNRRPSIAAGAALKAATFAPLPRLAAPSEPRPVFEELAASQPPTAAFEEPSEVLSIERLKVNPHLSCITGADRIAAERYRILSANLLDLVERRKLKTVLFSSAEAAEGKSTIAISLAWSIAQKFLAQKERRRVLLIDATRTFDTIRMLGINPKRGWLDLATGSFEPKHAMVRVDPHGLYVLTSGAYSAAEFTEGSSSRLESVIANLSARFDVILVDAPPILGSSDTQQLANTLDGSVLITRACHTHHSKVTAARKLIPKAKRLGVVLNESDADENKRDKGSLVTKLFAGNRRSA